MTTELCFRPHGSEPTATPTSPPTPDAARALLQLAMGCVPEAIAAAHARLDAALAAQLELPLTPALKDCVLRQRAQAAAARDVLLADAGERAVPRNAPRAGAVGLPGREAAAHANGPGEAPQDDLIGVVLARRYEVLEFIGEGGMGRVFRAFDRIKQSYVAVKVISPELVRQKGAQERFVTEAKLACSLSHPNIIRVHDVSAEDDSYFITMELLHGQTLRARLEQQKRARRPFPLEQGMEMARELLGGLSFAHQQLVHRDIKPENIWVCDDGTVKLMDFGVAQSIQGDRRTRTLQSVGSAYYVAPEQLRGMELDQRSDQYSIAVVLYELFSGRVPTGVVKPLQQLRTDLPAAAAAAVMTALSPSPEERFATIDALRQRFESPTSLRTLLPRSRVVRGAFAVVALAAIVGAAVMFTPRSALQDIHLVETRDDREGAIEAQAAVAQLFARADAVAGERQAMLRALEDRARAAAHGEDTSAEQARLKSELDVWSGMAYPATAQIQMQSRRAIADAAFKEGRFFAARENYEQLRAWLAPRVATIGRLSDLAAARAAALAATAARGVTAAPDARVARASEQVRVGDARVAEARADEAMAAYRDAVAVTLALREQERGRADALVRARAAEGRAQAQVFLAARSAGEAASRAEDARHAEQVRVGRQFRDRLASGGDGPDMVVVAAPGGGLAVQARSAAAVSGADFERFLRASGRTSQARQLATLYRDDAPEVAGSDAVTLPDAHAYAAWLSSETGQHYRVARSVRASDVGVTFWVARDLAP